MAFADGLVDFRSDTVTRPTPEMLAAMAVAPLGDDVYHDDPSVNALEEEAAAAVGKSSAVFMPTGTMGNQIAVMLHTRPGEEILADPGVHIRNVEAGGPAALSGVGFRTVDSVAGRVSAEQVDAAMANSGFFPRIRMMVWENTHNLSGGRVVPHELMAETSAAARRHGLKIHLDGARIFNAVVASGVGADTFAATSDTIQFCFSKGLGAPVGSVLCGEESEMAEARYLRKRMGGAMRQAGLLAAAARIALRDRDRLKEDHETAHYLAERLADKVEGMVDLDLVETNMVQVKPERLPLPVVEWRQDLASKGIKINPPLAGILRIVTHRDVDRRDVDRLVSTLG